MLDRCTTALTRAVDFSERGGTRLPSVSPDVSEYDAMDRGLLRKALDSVLCGANPGLGLEELRRAGLLGLLHGVPELVGFGGGSQGHKDLWEHTKTVVAQADDRPVIRWAALYHDAGKVRAFRDDGGKVTFHGHEAKSASIFRKFREKTRLFREGEGERVESIVRHLGRVEAFEGEWTDSAVRRLDREIGEVLDDCISLSRADITTGRDSKRQSILRSIDDLVARLARIRAEAEMPHLPKGLGDALHAELGVPKDEKLGALMGRMREALENGDIRDGATVQECVEYARRFAAGG